MPTQIKKSGDKMTVKISLPIASLLSSVRSLEISPMKGTKNPPHVHEKVPKSMKPKP